MKKSLVAMLVISFAGSVSADLSIAFQSNAGPVYENGGSIAGPYVADGSLVQLVWNSTSTYGNAGVGGAAGANEIILQTTVTDSGYGFWAAMPNALFVNADVGGANINSGYFYARIFNQASPLAGGNYGDTAMIDASLWNYDSGAVTPDPSKIYAQNFVSASGLEANKSVIPEPGTIGLVGAACLGLVMIRRTFRV